MPKRTYGSGVFSGRRSMVKARQVRFWLSVVLVSAASCYALWYVFLLILTWITPTLGTSTVQIDDHCPDDKWPVNPTS
jgi:low temperature requirement protein LtrA